MLKKSLFIFLLCIVTVPLYAYAFITIPGVTYDNNNPLPTSLTVVTQSLTERIVNWMITMFWIATVGFLIYAAYLYLTAAGNEDNVKKAKMYVIYALVAGMIALLATSLEDLVRNLLTRSNEIITGE